MNELREKILKVDIPAGDVSSMCERNMCLIRQYFGITDTQTDCSFLSGYIDDYDIPRTYRDTICVITIRYLQKILRKPSFLERHNEGLK